MLFYRGANDQVFMKKQRKDEDHYKRVILHLDLDCFYAQVEHNRLKVPLTVPLAVQQWNGLIAGTWNLKTCLILQFSQLCRKRCRNQTTRISIRSTFEMSST